ncbi:MAG: hypothetical protein HYW27_02710 [Candidatus Aenigmarchaeota archaeon]|nr:hypothetical protein [Candidatus Aenigmarchaeota archaeon]
MDMKELLRNQSVRKYVVIAAILALVVFVGGRMSGYLIAEDTYGTELSNLTERYNALNDTYASCLSDVSGMISSITSLENDKLALNASLSTATAGLQSCSSDLSGARTSIESKDTEISGLTSEKDRIAANSAKALCCVKKIFDSTLTAYYVENSTIICTSDTSKTPFAC